MTSDQLVCIQHKLESRTEDADSWYAEPHIVTLFACMQLQCLAFTSTTDLINETHQFKQRD